VPELPEVESVRRSLDHLSGRRVRAVSVFGPHAVSPPDFGRRLTGRTFLASQRHGKYLAFRLDDGSFLMCHLRMTGRLLYLPPRGRTDWPKRHTHVVMRLEGGGRLLFHDTRKFGRLWLAPRAAVADEFPAGVDALQVTPEDLRWPDRRAPIKSLLMDQRLIAGLGNIYADESLFRAGIDPRTPGGALTAEDRDRLASAIRAVLADALRFGGTTFLDYRDGSGRPGGFAAELAVYGRAGEPCRACGMALQSGRIGGRTTVWCGRCQRYNGPQ
jgi:formamidopyrimidine-DNA glycosylase